MILFVCMKKKLWIETDYFEDFKCKCGDCKRSCCSSFNVSISKDEYYKLITLPCSKELSDKINYSLIEPDFPTNDKYRVIGKNYLGDCPMLDESGLCMIHSQFGVDALPSVCKQYSRSLKKVNDVLLNILKKALLNTNNNNITSKADDYKQLLSNLCIEAYVDTPRRIRLA